MIKITETELKSIFNTNDIEKFCSLLTKIEDLAELIEQYPDYREEILQLLSSFPELIGQLIKTSNDVEKMADILDTRGVPDNFTNPFSDPARKIVASAEIIMMSPADHLEDCLPKEEEEEREFSIEEEEEIRAFSIEDLPQEQERQNFIVQYLNLFNQCLPFNKSLCGKSELYKFAVLNELKSAVQERRRVIEDESPLAIQLNNIQKTLAEIQGIPSLKNLTIMFFRENKELNMQGLPTDIQEDLPEDLQKRSRPE